MRTFLSVSDTFVILTVTFPVITFFAQLNTDLRSDAVTEIVRSLQISRSHALRSRVLSTDTNDHEALEL